jgi:hypothetical protein
MDKFQTKLLTAIELLDTIYREMGTSPQNACPEPRDEFLEARLCVADAAEEAMRALHRLDLL